MICSTSGQCRNLPSPTVQVVRLECSMPFVIAVFKLVVSFPLHITGRGFVQAGRGGLPGAVKTHSKHGKKTTKGIGDTYSRLLPCVIRRTVNTAVRDSTRKSWIHGRIWLVFARNAKITFFCTTETTEVVDTPCLKEELALNEQELSLTKNVPHIRTRRAYVRIYPKIKNCLF